MNEAVVNPGRPTIPAATARALALAAPVALLGGALLSQYVGGLNPCEMCYWQRWPHGVAIILAAGAFYYSAGSRPSRSLTALAALAIAVSGAIGVFHAGVEIGWWEGLTRCATGGPMNLNDVLSAPLVRCDQVQWSLAGISMAGWNAIISLGSAAMIAVLLTRKAT
ncbi:MAG: disulfide bond formation protein B [Sphingomicrobium sp.]